MYFGQIRKQRNLFVVLSDTEIVLERKGILYVVLVVVWNFGIEAEVLSEEVQRIQVPNIVELVAVVH